MALELELDFSTTGVLNVLDADGNTVNAIHLGQVTRGGQNNGDLLITNSVFLTRSDTHEVTIDSSDGKQYKLDIRDIATPTYATTQDLVDAIVTAIGSMYAGGGGGGGTVTSVNVDGGGTGYVFSGGPITDSGDITMEVDDQAAAQEAIGLPKTWNALVYYNGGSPTATVLGVNSIGTIALADASTPPGSGTAITLTLSGAFPSGKTTCICGDAGYDNNSDTGYVGALRDSANVITLYANPDYTFQGCPVEIKVYP